MEEQKIQPEDVRQDFELVAKTMRGLEDVLRDELVALGARDVEMGNRMVSFRGDKRMMYVANFCTRTALRVLKPVVKFTARDTDELYDRVRDLPWEDYISPDGTFAIDATVNSAEFSHSRYVTYRVKDAIVDHFTDKFRRRPSIRIQGADVLLNTGEVQSNQVVQKPSTPRSTRCWPPASSSRPAGAATPTSWTPCAAPEPSS